jgi:hypothetical protein
MAEKPSVEVAETVTTEIALTEDSVAEIAEIAVEEKVAVKAEKGSSFFSSLISGVTNATKAKLDELKDAALTKAVPLEVPADVTEIVKSMVSSGIDGGGAPTDSRLSDLTWGHGITSSIPRHSAAFYRLTVDSRQVNSGFFLLCRSARDKVKVFIFNGVSGELVHKEDSIPNGKENVAACYFTNFQYQIESSTD